MKRLQSALFVVLCFALGVGLAMAYIHLRAPRPAAESESATGVGDAPPLRGFSVASPADVAVLPEYPPLHATAVAVDYSSDTKALGVFVRQAHARHLAVVLLPPPKASATNPFPVPLAQVARQAQDAGVDILCISWLHVDPDPDFWQPRIAEVRRNFAGRIILAATPDLLPGIEFFGQVDLIGAIGPFDLSVREPTTAQPLGLHDLRVAWASYLDALESLSFRYGKPLVILNIHVPAPAARSASDAGAMLPKAEPGFAALAYEALVTETKGRSGTEGLFLNWNAGAKSGGKLDEGIPGNGELLQRIAALWNPAGSGDGGR